MKKAVLFTLFCILSVCLFAGPAFAENDFINDPIAINNAAKSVLMLEIYDDQDDLIATGSGFVAFNNKTLVTNYHVIEGADYILANSDGNVEQYIIMKVLIADSEKDIAIVSFFSPTDLVPLTLSDNKNMMRAEPVIAIGSPKGFTNTVSTGIISNIYNEDGFNRIQFTAPISPGSSGGALFNGKGEVIGITSSTYIDSQNLNFAIQITEVIDLYNQWDGKTATALGDYVDENSEARAEEYCQKGEEYLLAKDYEAAYDCFDKAAQLNSAKAYDRMGDMYYYGWYVDADPETAFLCYYISAQMGDSSGMADTFWMYYNEETTEIDAKEAFDWAKKSANAGNARGMRYLGYCYEGGIGTSESIGKAIEMYEKAAENGDDYSYFWVGCLYLLHEGHKNYTKAFSYFNYLAEKEDSKGYMGLGLYYYLCPNVPANEQHLAITYFKKTLDCDNANYLVCEYLGCIYYDGYGTQIDVGNAAYYFTMAYELSGDEKYKAYADECIALAATPKPTATPKKTATPKPTTKRTLTSYVIITGNCNIRSGAGTEYNKVGAASKGDVYPYLGREYSSDGSAWNKINYAGKTGYVAATYCEYKSEYSDIMLDFGDYGNWDNSGTNLHFHFEVFNSSIAKTVQAYNVSVYTVDKSGRKSAVMTYAISQNIKPNTTVYSKYIDIPKMENIDRVYIAIKRTFYTDGTSVAVDENNLKYYYWVIN